MGTGYTRNDTSNNIADGNIINASDLDGEFDAVESAFGTSGHTHDGTSAEGGPVTVLGPVQDFVASATEIKPKTTNTLDIGTNSLLFKDMFLDGVATLGSIKIDNAGTIGSASDSDAIAISSGGVVSFSQNTIGKTASGHVLSIQTSHTTMESGDVLGKIEFSAPDEASGTDAILVGASIEALAEDTFSSSVNSSALVFKTNTTGAATERMRIKSDGNISLTGATTISNTSGDLTFDVASDIILDAAGGDILLKKGSTHFGSVFTDNTNLFIQAMVNAGDFYLSGKDSGGTGINALVLDMGNSGAATFNSTITLKDTLSISSASTSGFLQASSNVLQFGTSSDDPVTFFANNAERMRITSDGDVSITSGTLTVSDTSDPAQIKLRQSSNSSGLIIKNFNGNEVQFVNVDSGPIVFKTNDSEKIRIKSTGDLGIGTGSGFTVDDITGSGFGLVIGKSSASSAGIQIRTGTSGVGRIYFGDNSGSDAARKRGAIEFNHSTDDLTITAADVINLDAGTQIILKDDGSNFGTFYQDSSDFFIQSLAQDKDIVLFGNVGGVGTAALRLDMSEAGAATFNAGATFNSTVNIDCADGAADNAFALRVLNQEATDDRSYGLYIQAGSTGVDHAVDIRSHDSGSQLFRITGSGLTGVGMVPDTAVRMSVNGAVGTTNGSASSPTHTFYGDPDTGMLRVASNILGFSTGGTERAQIGSFGVATDHLVNRSANSDLTLDAVADIILDAGGGDLIFKDDGTQIGRIRNASSGEFTFQSDVSDKNMVFNGKDGGSTITALTINMSQAGEADFNSAVKVSGGIVAHQTNKGVLEYNNNIFMMRSYGASSSSGSLQFKTGGGGGTTDTLAMTINNAQNVAIGSTGNPIDEILHIEKASGTTLVKTEVGGNSTVGFEIKKTGATTSNWRIADGQTVNGKLEIFDVTDNRSIMTFDGDGNVGIGTISPNNSLDVNGGIVCSPNTDGKNTFELSTSAVDEGRLRIKNVDTTTVEIRAGGNSYFNGGALLVGKTASDGAVAGFEARQNGEVFATLSSGNTYFLNDTSTNKFFVNANGGISNFQSNNVNLSDQREKKNIEALDSQWDALKQWALKKFHYNFDNDSDPKKVGVIAQDVQVNHPNLISDFQYTEDETRLAVKEQQMMWMAIKTLQEAQDRIEVLEARITALEGA